MALIDEMPPLGWDVDEQWSTVAQGETFEKWIAANVPGFTRRVLGATGLGSELAVLIVGTGTETMYINGGIHGNEYAGRECVYVWVQAWARAILNGDTTLGGLLTRRRFVIVCQSNPDGRATGNYGNADNVDPAQDGFRLHAPERQAIERVFQDYKPIVVTDHHEYIGSGHNLWTLGNRGVEIHPDLAAASGALHAAVDAAVAADGWSVSTYEYNRARALGHSATFRHCLALLCESKTGALNTENPPDPRATRMAVHNAAIAAAVDYFDTNASAIATACEASRQAALTGSGPERHSFNGITMNASNTYTQYVEGYELDRPLPAVYRDLYGIVTEEGGLFVPIRQEARGFLPEIMDPAVEGRGVVAVQRIDKTLLPGAPTSAYVRVGGVTHAVTGMVLMVDGVRQPVAFG